MEVDEDDKIEFPAWMIQYSQAVKTIETKTIRENVGQVQGSSSSGCNLSSRPSSCSSNTVVNEKYLHLVSPLRSLDEGLSNLQHVGEIAYECERLLNDATNHQEPLLIGLDLDWPSTYAAFIVKTKTIHLCVGENHCLLFEVLHVKKLPLVFIKLIKHPNVRLIGHNIIEDLLKLGKDFKVDVKQVISSNLILSPVSKKLSCKHHWSYREAQVYHDEKAQALEKFTCEPDLDTTARFLGKIKYCTTFEDCAVFSEELLVRADHCHQLALGFDLEWPFRYGQGSGKVALIQICPDETICYIFHVFQLKSLPKALVLLLRHPKVRLTGLNIANDIRKLARDFNIDLSDVLKNNLIELCTFANEKLHCHHRWSLAGLVANQLHIAPQPPNSVDDEMGCTLFSVDVEANQLRSVLIYPARGVEDEIIQLALKIDLDKGPVRVSNWAKKDLSEQQISYAATDAYVSLLCYLKLNSVEDA